MILPLVSAWGWMGCLWRSAFFGDAIEKAGNSLHGGSSYIIRGRLARIKHHTSVGGPSVPVDVVFSKFMEVEEIAGNLPEAQPYLSCIPFRVARNMVDELMRRMTIGTDACLKL